jgi:hypothetical protein
MCFRCTFPGDDNGTTPSGGRIHPPIQSVGVPRPSPRPALHTPPEHHPIGGGPPVRPSDHWRSTVWTPILHIRLPGVFLFLLLGFPHFCPNALFRGISTPPIAVGNISVEVDHRVEFPLRFVFGVQLEIMMHALEPILLLLAGSTIDSIALGVREGDDLKVRIAFGNLLQPFVASSAGSEGVDVLEEGGERKK